MEDLLGIVKDSIEEKVKQDVDYYHTKNIYHNAKNDLKFLLKKKEILSENMWKKDYAEEYQMTLTQIVAKNFEIEESRVILHDMKSRRERQL